MKFVLLLALREMRQAWRKLLFFFLCVAVGVGSIVALRSMIGNLNRAVAGEARALLTADVQIDSTRQWRAETIEAINRIAAASGVEARVETIELPTMLRPANEANDAAMMVELKGVEAGYPLVGEFTLQNGEAFRHELLSEGGAVVAAALLDRLNLEMGDRVQIGNSVFQIRGAIEREPGAGGFRLGPRVFVDRAQIEATGLVGFGSRARHKILLRTAEDEMPAVINRLREEVRDPLVTVRSYRESEENLSAQFTRAEDYLSLAGLAVLVLGGVGVSNVTRVFIEQKRKTIAVLKCLGATGGRITLAYLLQTLALGLAGSLLGILLARSALFFVAWQFAESLPVNLSYSLRAGAVLQGFALGMLVSFLFSILPLLRIRSVRPRTLLRDGGIIDGDVNLKHGSLDLTRWMIATLVTLALVGVAAWQANSIRVGFLFLAGLAVTAGSLYAVAGLLINLLRRLSRRAGWTGWMGQSGSFALKQAVNSLHRPGNQTRVVIMAIGLGVFLVITIQQLQANLLDEIDPSRRGNLPSMFLIDVQSDQRAGVEEITETATGTRPSLVPVVRARIVAVDEREIDLDASERTERGRLGREYTVTYRPTLEANETLIDGNFWDTRPLPTGAEAEVSLEEGMRGLAGIELGSRVTFDILGRRTAARVTSFRRVDWRNSRTGFLILFRPGTLEAAPQTFVAPVDAPSDAGARARYQYAIVNRYPNISVIDVSEIVRSVRQILNNVTLAVAFVGGFVALSGILILAGSIAMTKYQRVYETAVLKTLGAERKILLTILFAEYGLVGLVAGVTGACAGILLSYAVARFVFEIEWTFAPAISLIGILATVALVVIIGALASFDVLMRKPLATLRAG